MENRGALRFVAGTLPREPHQWGQSAQSRNPSCTQPRGQCTSSGSLTSTEKSNLPRRAVPTLAQQAWRSESHHRYGPSARPTGLSHAEVWSALRRQRRGILSAKKPPATNRLPQEEGRTTRPPGNSTPCLKLATKKLLESRITGQMKLAENPLVR